MTNKFFAWTDKLPGPLLIFFGAFLWSTAGGVAKLFEMDAALLPGLRSLLSGLALLPCLRLRRVVWDKWLLGAVLSFSLLCLLLMGAIRLTTASNALALQFTAPLWIALYQWLKQHNRPKGRRLLVLILMLGGVIVILCEPNTGSNALGNIMGVGSGIFFATFSVCSKKAQGGGYLGLLALMNLCCAALIMIPLLLWPGYEIVIQPRAIPYVLYLGLIEMSGGYLLFMLGSRRVSAQKATVLCIWEFLLTPVWAFLLARELPTIYGGIGWVVLLAAILLEQKVRETPPGSLASPTKVPLEQGR